MCILLVEDEPFIREIMAEFLQEAGYEVVEAANGDIAIEMIGRLRLRPTILVTDFHMPGETNGARVAACARHAFPGIHVVITSGRPEVMQHYWQHVLGYKFLKKPYLPSNLVAVVNLLASPIRNDK